MNKHAIMINSLLMLATAYAPAMDQHKKTVLNNLHLPTEGIWIFHRQSETFIVTANGTYTQIRLLDSGEWEMWGWDGATRWKKPAWDKHNRPQQVKDAFKEFGQIEYKQSQARALPPKRCIK